MIKQDQNQEPKEKFFLKEKSNSIGNTENDQNRIKALSNLDKAKILENDQKKQGYKWMQSGKTNAFVHPEKCQSYLEKGFKFI